MDNTVRLWDMATKTCLRRFPHSDYGEFRPSLHFVQLMLCRLHSL